MLAVWCDISCHIWKFIYQARFQWLRDEIGEIIDIKNPVTKLRRFISLWFATFMGDRDFVRVFLLDIKSNKKFYVSQAYRDYFNFVSLLETILEEGQAQGIFKSNINRRLFRNLFLGGFTHLTSRWAILNNAKNINIMDDIEELVSLLCRLVVTEKAALHDIEHQIG
jgi:TetR/AcrR family transcriptional regulator, fatty acid metabolism regulator protein